MNNLPVHDACERLTAVSLNSRSSWRRWACLGIVSVAGLAGCQPESEPPAASTVGANSVDMPRTVNAAKAALHARSGSNVGGVLNIDQQDGIVRIHGEISGLTPGVHGLHVHETGDCSAPDGSSAGEHFAPRTSQHGAPTQAASQHHAGDLGNIVANESGIATIDVIDDSLSLAGGDSIVGRAIVVHAAADDLTSQPSGNSGDRVGCGIVERVPAPSIAG